jgi:four helix bundle protein
VKRLPRTIVNYEYSKQLIRSAGSIAANYIEANDSLGVKDFFMHIKICRKESKESGLWLRLLDTAKDNELVGTQSLLNKESQELALIFAAIVRKSSFH